MIAKIGSRLIEALKPESRPFHIRDPDLIGFLIRVQPSGVATYSFEYKTRKGQKRRYKIARVGSISPAQARDEAKKLSALVVQGVDVQDAKKITVDPTLEQLLAQEGYEKWAITHKKRGAQTVAKIRSRFALFLKQELSSIDIQAVEKWRSMRIESGIKPQTVNRNTASLKAALEKATEWNLIKENPLKKLKPLQVEDQGRERYLSPEEETRIRKVLEERDNKIREVRENGNLWRKKRGYELMPSLKDKAFVSYVTPMVLLVLNTGLRRGEVCSLKKSNVNLGGRWLKISGVYSKNSRTSYLPLNEEAFYILSHWMAENADNTSEFVFPSRDGKPLREIKTAWRSILKKAKVEDFRFHDLRHTFASNLVMNGVALNTVRMLLSHQSTTMVTRYAHLSPSTKADAVATLNARPNATESKPNVTNGDEQTAPAGQ